MAGVCTKFRRGMWGYGSPGFNWNWLCGSPPVSTI